MYRVKWKNHWWCVNFVEECIRRYIVCRKKPYWMQNGTRTYTAILWSLCIALISNEYTYLPIPIIEIYSTYTYNISEIFYKVSVKRLGPMYLKKHYEIFKNKLHFYLRWYNLSYIFKNERVGVCFYVFQLFFSPLFKTQKKIWKLCISRYTDKQAIWWHIRRFLPHGFIARSSLIRLFRERRYFMNAVQLLKYAICNNWNISGCDRIQGLAK